MPPPPLHLFPRFCCDVSSFLCYAAAGSGENTNDAATTQYVDAKIVNMLLLAYFTFIGSFALAATVDPVLVQIFGTTVRETTAQGRWLRYRVPG